MSGYSLTTQLVGAKELQAALANSSNFAKNELAKALNKAANDATREAEKLAPHKTGALWGSLHVGNPHSVSQMATPDSLRAIVGTNLEYAKYQEEGTGIYGPHNQSFTIVPKNKKALYWKGASHPVKQVTIQGIKPKWYLKQAMENIRANFTTYLQTAASRIIADLAGK